MLCQSVLGSFWSVIPGLITPGTPSLHLSQCSSRSTYITSPHQYYTNLHLNTVFTLDHSTLVWSVSLPAHVWTKSVAQHFHHLHVNAFCGSHSESSYCEWIKLSLHMSCYFWMSRVPLITSCDLEHVTSECVMLPHFTLFSVKHIHMSVYR